MRILIFNFNKTLTYLLSSMIIITLLSISTIIINAQEAGAKDKLQLPIIMYHNILKDKSRSGKFVITPDEFEADLLYIKENNFTTIVMEDLIEYVQNGKPLPPKPIIITFDDGYLNTYEYAYPLLKKHNMKAIISVIGVHIDKFTENEDRNVNYGHSTWNDLKEMVESGLIEIQNHSYNLHSSSSRRRGATKNKNESDDEYRSVLKEDLAKVQDKLLEITGKSPTTFTYPFGAYSKETVGVLKELGFVASMSCYEGLNYIDGDNLFNLKRFNRPSGISTEKYFKKVLSKYVEKSFIVNFE